MALRKEKGEVIPFLLAAYRGEIQWFSVYACVCVILMCVFVYIYICVIACV